MWHVNTELNTPCPRIDDENGRGVAHVIQRDPHPAHGHGVTYEQAMYRAQLMALAPDLLDALESLVSEPQPLGIDRPAYQWALAALSKIKESSHERPHP